MNEGKGIKEIISKKEPGIEICKINDCEAVYYSIEGTPMTYIFINLPGIEAFLSFMCMPAESKEEMEKLLEQTKWFEDFAIKVD